jgi:hypothetical protein
MKEVTLAQLLIALAANNWSNIQHVVIIIEFSTRQPPLKTKRDLDIFSKSL